MSVERKIKVINLSKELKFNNINLSLKKLQSHFNSFV